MPAIGKAGAVGTAEPVEGEASPVTAFDRCRWCDLARDQVDDGVVRDAEGHDDLIEKEVHPLERECGAGPGDGAARSGEAGPTAGESSPESFPFVVVRSSSSRSDEGASLTLVPRKHVRTLTELLLPEMAEVLAGLAKASVEVQRLSGAARVEIHADPDGHNDGSQHLHFRVEAR